MLYGRIREDSARIWRGPKRAPGRWLVPVSRGTPMKPAFRPWALVATGSRIMLARPPKRGMVLPPSGWLKTDSLMAFSGSGACQLVIQMGLHGRPFTGQDAVNAGVAQRALRVWVAVDLVRTQHAVELGAQALDAAPALVVEEVGAELHRDAVQRLERVGQQQALALGVERAALHGGAVPGGADLDPAVGGIDVHEGGHADRLAAGVQHRERQHAAGFLQAQAAFDFGGHALGCGDAGVPELPELAGPNGLEDPK